MTAPRTFTTKAIASKDSLTVNPDELNTVIDAERRRLTLDVREAGYRRQGPWRYSWKWARPVGVGWLRTPKRLATARVVTITCQAVPR